MKEPKVVKTDVWVGKETNQAKPQIKLAKPKKPSEAPKKPDKAPQKQNIAMLMVGLGGQFGLPAGGFGGTESPQQKKPAKPQSYKQSKPHKPKRAHI